MKLNVRHITVVAVLLLLAWTTFLNGAHAAHHNELTHELLVPTTFQKHPEEHASASGDVGQFIVTKTAHPFNMALHKTQDLISEALQKTGKWEDGISNVFEEVFSTAVACAEKRETPLLFIDVGANIGYFSLLAASFGLNVLSIEAMEYNAGVLRASIFKNDNFDRLISLHKVGLSSVTGGALCMKMPHGNAGNGIATFMQDPTGPCLTAPVLVSTLDAEVLPFVDSVRPQIVGMKMDIEGFEPLALKGGMELLSKNRPCYVWFEYQRDAIVASDVDPFDMLDRLHKLGYVLSDIATPKKVLSPPWANVPKAMFFQARLPKCNARDGCSSH